MQGSSRAAAAAAQRAFDDALTAGVGPERLSEDLFAMAAALDSSAALRRALADPSRDPAVRSALALRVFGTQVSERSARLVAGLAGHRWSGEHDLGDTVEDLAVQALVAAAEASGSADQVEDELFRFERIVAANPDLREALTDRHVDAEARAGLVTRLLGSKASRQTVRLVRRAVLNPRGQRFDRVVEGQLATIAQRRRQLAATVTTAIELDVAQRDRLAHALSRLYERPVVVHAVVDPGVLGGLRIRIGDEVLDGSVLRRLEAARRHMGA